MFDRREIDSLSPRLSRRHPLKRSRYYDETFRLAVEDWFLSYGLLPAPEQQAVLRTTNFPYVTSVCWPASDRRSLFDLARLTVALNVRDHEFDTHHRGRIEPLSRALIDDLASGHPTGSDPRWGPVFTDIWHRFSSYLPEQLMTKITTTVVDYLQGCVAYDHNLLTHGQPRDVDEYLQWRHRTVGQYIDHRMIEISLNIDLADVILSEPRVQHLQRSDVRRTILAQDILSVRKELLDREQENIVAVLAVSQRCPLREALRQACVLYDSAMDQFDQARNDLLTSDFGAQDELRRWLDGLNDFHAGLIDWSTGSTRYTLRSESTWTTPDMIIDETRYPHTTA